MNKRLFLFWGVLVVMVVVVSGGYLIWKNYFAFDEAKLYAELEKKYVEAMTADTYGGKTPQETLDMFVDALRKGDVELASKYFMLDDNLSREKWVEELNDIKKRGLLNAMVSDIAKRAQLDLENRIDENDFEYVLYVDDGTVGARIDMQFNRYSKVWKIESL